MECCYLAECDDYSVTPMLMSPPSRRKYQAPQCYPRLPRCQKPVYYGEDRPPRRVYDCSDPPPQKGCCSPNLRRGPPSAPPQSSFDSCCYQPPHCKPVKTKYIMPCYRYEDGRIANQPTVLMRRACEVACGKRKRKPFLVSSFAADPHNEIRRFHAEDERGNCCYHFERKKPPKCESCESCWNAVPCEPCDSYQQHCPECQYVDNVYAHPLDETNSCHY